MSHRRGKRTMHPNVTLVKIEGVENTKDAQFYLGKVCVRSGKTFLDRVCSNRQRIAYIYKAPNETRGQKYRVIWGRVTRTHGNNGVVRSKFRNNIPPAAFGASVRVLLYPSNSKLNEALALGVSNVSLKCLFRGWLRMACMIIPIDALLETMILISR